MGHHESYMRRCIELGNLALGTARPNPMVGCVIVHENKIIAEGYTSPFGGPHAEVVALNAVKDKNLLPHSELYVSLEPCSHFGKTPPCANLIVESGVRDVIIGCLDPNPKVSGNGIRVLRENGCIVTNGVLENECREHFKRFLCYHERKRPYIILKWAQTADGFIAPKRKEKAQPVWITNPVSRQLVHKWRGEEQCILVGHNTVIADNPSLNTRDWHGSDPVKIILTKEKNLDKSLNIFKSAAPLILDSNCIDYDKPVAGQLCKVLYDKEITSVIVEGGTRTLNHFIQSGIWDEARVFIGSVEFKDGIKAPAISKDPIHSKSVSGDQLLTYRND